jgi:hypothetical protein
VKKVFEDTTAAKILMTLIVFGERIREVNRLNVKRLIGNMRLCKFNPFPFYTLNIICLKFTGILNTKKVTYTIPTLHPNIISLTL